MYRYCCCMFFLLLMCTEILTQTFRPVVTVNSCTSNKVTITIAHATMGGIVYVKGAGHGCRHETFYGTNHLEFLYAACGLVWGQPFHIVVQKNKLYQTSEDKVIPITCTVDLSQISLETIINTAPKYNEPARTVRVKPSAFMTLTRGGFNINGRVITIGEIVTLRIELHNQFKGALDINANRCSVSNIILVTGGCTTDSVVFPQFSKPRTGILQSTFKAFIPTDQLTSGRVVFSCIVDICLNTCPTPSCPFDVTLQVAGNGQNKNMSLGIKSAHTLVFVSFVILSQLYS